MYVMNDDLFDSFSVLFGKGESVILGKHYPLGTFAVEALDMDRGILRDLEQKIAVLQEEFTVFLSARDSSSAALAHQAINRVWELLEALPVYRLLKDSGRNARNLMRYIREHPDEVDDMLTAGTGRNQMLRSWVEKLSRFSAAIHNFLHDTQWMLENYFEELPSRLPESYANAYGQYCFEVREDLRIRLEAQEETADISELYCPTLSFPVRLSFAAVTTPGTSKRVLAEQLEFEDLTSFLYTDLYRGMAAGNIPRRCHNCGCWFLAMGGYDTRYCDRIAPGETKKTCRKVGAHKKEKLKNGTVFVQKEYMRAYNRLKARKNRGAITTDVWNGKVAEAQNLKDQAIRGEISDAELTLKLDEL